MCQGLRKKDVYVRGIKFMNEVYWQTQRQEFDLTN